jgi:hypothetical protein
LAFGCAGRHPDRVEADAPGTAAASDALAPVAPAADAVPSTAAAVAASVPPAAPLLPAARVAAWLARAADFGLTSNSVLLVVSLPEQRLACLVPGQPQRVYRVSTSRRGAGSRKDSQGTPLGWHGVAARIGEDARPGQVFVSRRPVRRVLPPAAWTSGSDNDLVLTRILHLRGLEPGRNAGEGVDSFRRCIYLHGTNQEQLLGRPASHGCVRLSNHDVMEVFDLTAGRPTLCWIVDRRLAET